MILDKIKSRGEEMAPLEGHDRLQYIIDEAKKVEPLAQEHKIDENKIRGCVSNLWVTGKVLEAFDLKIGVSFINTSFLKALQ